MRNNPVCQAGLRRDQRINSKKDKESGTLGDYGVKSVHTAK